MKTLLIATALALATGNAFAGVAPGCIGGCMGSAPNAGDITLPAGYQFVTGWPNYAPTSCVVEQGRESQFTITQITKTVHGHTEVVGRVRN